MKTGLAYAPDPEPLRVHPLGEWGAGADSQRDWFRSAAGAPRCPAAPGIGCLSRGRLEKGRPFCWRRRIVNPPLIPGWVGGVVSVRFFFHSVPHWSAAEAGGTVSRGRGFNAGSARYRSGRVGFRAALWVGCRYFETEVLSPVVSPGFLSC